MSQMRERGERKEEEGDEKVEKGRDNDFLGTCRSELSSCRHSVLLFHAGIILDSDGNYAMVITARAAFCSTMVSGCLCVCGKRC